MGILRKSFFILYTLRLQVLPFILTFFIFYISLGVLFQRQFVDQTLSLAVGIDD